VNFLSIKRYTNVLFTLFYFTCTTTWAIKRSQLIFVRNFFQKSKDFDALFIDRLINERHMWQYELHPPHLINVATLACESQNAENLILQWDIIKEYCMRYHSFIKVDQGHHMPYTYLFGVLYSKVCMKQRLMTSMTCENAWCKLGLPLTEMIHQNIWWKCQCNLMHVTAIL